VTSPKDTAKPDVVTTYLDAIRRSSAITATEDAIDGSDWHHHLERRDNELSEVWWAWEAVDDLVASKPADAWSMLVAIVSATTDDETLAVVAAGHLQDFLETYGTNYLTQIENRARIDPRFRKALSGVWLESRHLKRSIRPMLAPPYLDDFSESHWS
jgi:hypothetical protein